MDSKNCKRCFSLSVLTVVFFSFIQSGFSQESSTFENKRDLYVYGTSIDSNDASKVQVSADLFYSQLQLSDDFTLYDRRSTVYSADVLDVHKNTNDVLFYNEIIENEDMWSTSLHLVDFSTDKEVFVKYEYSEYYRILIDAKDVLNELIEKYKASYTGLDSSSNIEPSVNSTPSSITVTNLFGTWYGEEHVDKIVILRGGKGFVIFENGASMNISVSVDGSTFLARQESQSNASFFPELPREVALVKALDGSLIEWELTIENENSLSGVKHTFGASLNNNGETIAIKEEIPVKWYR